MKEKQRKFSFSHLCSNVMKHRRIYLFNINVVQLLTGRLHLSLPTPKKKKKKKTSKQIPRLCIFQVVSRVFAPVPRKQPRLDTWQATSYE